MRRFIIQMLRSLRITNRRAARPKSRRRAWVRCEALEERAVPAAISLSKPVAPAASTIRISAGAEALVVRQATSRTTSLTNLTTNASANAGPVVGGISPLTDSPELTRGFDAINFDQNAALNDGSYSIPPDPHGAVGRDYLVNVVNTSIQAYTKFGGLVLNQRLGKIGSGYGGFFAPLNPVNSLFDPKVIYDTYSDRFVVVALEHTSSSSRILVAASDNADPFGTWYYLAINSKINISGSDCWADYPGLAFDEEAIYITNNMFRLSDNAFFGERLWSINKTQLYSGLPNPSVFVSNPEAAIGQTGMGTIQPASMYAPGPGSTGTFLVNTNLAYGTGQEALTVIRIDNPLSNSPAFSVTYLPVGDLQANFAAFPNAPQLGTSTLISTNDYRAQNAVYRNGSLYATNTYLRNSGPNNGQETAIWYRVNTSNLASLSLAELGEIGGEEIATGTRTFFPSIAVNSDGDVAVGFAASGPSIYAGAYYASRQVTDAAGTMDVPTALMAGQDRYVRQFSGSRNRWGDYSATVVDPTDDSFWVFNEYASTRGTILSQYPTQDGRWATRWGRFTEEAFVTVFDLNGSLLLTGDEGSNTIRIIALNNNGDVRVEGLDGTKLKVGSSILSSYSTRLSRFGYVSANLGRGDDTLVIQGLNSSDPLMSALYAYMEDGSDYVAVFDVNITNYIGTYLGSGDDLVQDNNTRSSYQYVDGGLGYDESYVFYSTLGTYYSVMGEGQSFTYCYTSEFSTYFAVIGGSASDSVSLISSQLNGPTYLALLGGSDYVGLSGSSFIGSFYSTLGDGSSNQLDVFGCTFRSLFTALLVGVNDLLRIQTSTGYSEFFDVFYALIGTGGTISVGNGSANQVRFRSYVTYAGYGSPTPVVRHYTDSISYLGPLPPTFVGVTRINL